MQIKMVPIADIIPYENNPRKNKDAVQYVKNSIKEFGFKVPIIVDKENVIVAETSIPIGMTAVI
jgi:ParB-like chromosome segregation protein Spo0J